MAETPEELYERVKDELRMPPVEEWDSFPFDGEMAPRPLHPPVEREEPRHGEGGVDCRRCQATDDEYVEQVSQAVATDADTASYVEELERRADSLDLLEDSDDLPSGDALAAEITRFLRERDENGDTPESGGPG